MLMRESRSMAMVVPASSLLSIWVIDSSDFVVPVNSRAATAAARSGLGRRTVMVCRMRGGEGHGGGARPCATGEVVRHVEQQRAGEEAGLGATHAGHGVLRAEAEDGQAGHEQS